VLRIVSERLRAAHPDGIRVPAISLSAKDLEELEASLSMLIFGPTPPAHLRTPSLFRGGRGTRLNPQILRSKILEDISSLLSQRTTIDR